ncbi:MAG TPA: hypothetical protein PLS70_23150, partial [Acidobacteriota bacterium]|nr:hypothetical protein [Acidobacteriota bacterium]
MVRPHLILLLIFGLLTLVGQPCRAVSEPLKPLSSPTINTDLSAQCVPAIRVYNSQNGLPQSAVRALAFDQKGYL